MPMLATPIWVRLFSGVGGYIQWWAERLNFAVAFFVTVAQSYMVRPDLVKVSTIFYFHHNFVIVIMRGGVGSKYLIMKRRNFKFKFSPPMAILYNINTHPRYHLRFKGYKL